VNSLVGQGQLGEDELRRAVGEDTPSALIRNGTPPMVVREDRTGCGFKLNRVPHARRHVNIGLVDVVEDDIRVAQCYRVLRKRVTEDELGTGLPQQRCRVPVRRMPELAPQHRSPDTLKFYDGRVPTHIVLQQQARREIGSLVGPIDIAHRAHWTGFEAVASRGADPAMRS
jgi:hypothetical protein